MLRRLRRGFRHSIGQLGPLLVTLVALMAAGLGTHAVLDWHHHGEVGGGFFHLHVHFGEHRHAGLGGHEHNGPGDYHHDELGDHHDQAADHDHDHGELEHQNHESPEPASPSEDRRECGTLTHVFGVTSAPKVAQTGRPMLETHALVSSRIRELADRQVVACSWSPRGPPA